jgi:hypothetical protein
MPTILNFTRTKIKSLLLVVFLLPGCKAPEVIIEKPPESIFTAREDTVKIQSLKEIETDRTTASEISDGFYFAVQLGAYQQPLNAERTRRLAQERFTETESNTEFDPESGLYKITIGNFNTYQEACIFRERIIQRYPADYTDAWIVSIKHKPRKL